MSSLRKEEGKKKSLKMIEGQESIFNKLKKCCVCLKKIDDSDFYFEC